MKIVLNNTVNVKIEFEKRSTVYGLSGPLYKEEILIIAWLIYKSQGDLEQSITVTHQEVLNFKKYKLDINHKQFKEICRGITYRRGYFTNQFGSCSCLWIDSYEDRGGLWTFKLNHNVAGVVEDGRYRDFVDGLLCYMNRVT